MSSPNHISTFSYNKEDFNFTVNLFEKSGSLFDNILQHEWKKAEKNKVFRYILNIRESKILKGKYRFLAQLNVDRGHYRRTPESITSVSQSFNPIGFNFTKLTQQEILFDIGNGDTNDIVAINASPLEQYHCLLLTNRLKCLPQIMTKYSLSKILELCLLSKSWSLRAAFNGLCAQASINHLHWHLYHLKYEMLLEYIDFIYEYNKNVCGSHMHDWNSSEHLKDLYTYIPGIHLLLNYPAKAFCIKLSDFENVEDFASKVFLLVNYLQLRKMAYNVYITRAKSRFNDKLYNDMRIYIWVRKPLTGVKNTTAFTIGACELFGHLSIKDGDTYDNLTENDVINILYNITEEYFLLIKDELKTVLKI